MIKIELPFKTPTINHLYWHKGTYKIMKTEAKNLQKKIKEIVGKIEVREVPLKVQTFIYEDWYFKNGKVAKKDVANREKFLIDSLFKALGVDDKFIFESRLVKVQSKDMERAIIVIEEIC